MDFKTRSSSSPFVSIRILYELFVVCNQSISNSLKLDYLTKITKKIFLRSENRWLNNDSDGRLEEHDCCISNVMENSQNSEIIKENENNQCSEHEEMVSIPKTTFKKLLDESIELIKYRKRMEQIERHLTKKIDKPIENPNNVIDEVSTIADFCLFISMLKSYKVYFVFVV